MFTTIKFIRLTAAVICMSMLCLVLSYANDSINPSSHIIDSMPANSWLEIPNTKLESVAADAEKYPDIQAYMGIHGITAYSGGVYDTKRKRLVVWGGGHADYQGNEIYAFDVEKLVWERLNNPSNANYCQQVNSDGTPNSRHTYNGITYIEHVDRLFASGGSLACDGGGCGADITWTFDFNSLQWADMKPPNTPQTNCENLSAYDPLSKKVWWFDAPGLWSYDYDKNKWKQHNNDDVSRRTAVVDTKRGLLIVVGQGEVVAYNVAARDYKQRVWATVGADEFIENWSPGLAYDPVTDRIVGWAGKSVYALNIDTKQWTEHDATGAPSIEALNSIYGLWRYVPSLNVFIAMTGANKNIFFYKFTP